MLAGSPSLGGVATRTSTIKLATGVFILPLRHPIMVARSVVTVDRMSGGRVILGMGVGWMPDEFEIVGDASVSSAIPPPWTAELPVSWLALRLKLV